MRKPMQQARTNHRLCLSTDEVAAYVGQACAENELVLIRDHLSSCVECHNEVEKVRTACEQAEAEDRAHPEIREAFIDMLMATMESQDAARKGRLN